MLFSEGIAKRCARIMQHKPSITAFSLVELLVVVAIIALLAAILFPVFASARQKARDTSCLSNMKQIGLGVQQYVQDYDGTFPIFYAYNSIPSAGAPGHKGIELELQPYTKSLQIFKCPNDLGGPYVSTDGDCKSDPAKQDSYFACYGSSYRFTSGTYSIIDGESSQNNVVASDKNNNAALPSERVVKDASFEKAAETRIMRDEMFPWFGPEQDPNGTRYGYYPLYYRQWHPTGGTFLFADGHAKFIVRSAQFDEMWVNPEATKHFGSDPSDPNYPYDGD